VISEPSQPADEEDDNIEEPESFREKLLKLFAHGFLFSLIVGNLGTFLAIVLFPLAVLFFVLGLILLILALIILVGWTNVKLADYFWGIKCSTSVKSYLGHGLMLIVTLFLFYIPLGAYEWAILSDYPEFAIVSRLVIIVLYSIIDGFLVRLISEQFLDPNEYVGGSLRHRRGTDVIDHGMKKPRPIQGLCPHCSAAHWYDESALAEDGSLQCKSCGERYIFKKADSKLE
jgi:DNA-directed RNA polymerase subunit RPC12/RpoP